MFTLENTILKGFKIFKIKSHRINNGGLLREALLTSTWPIKSDLSVRSFVRPSVRSSVTLICPMVSALLFASRYSSQKSKSKIKGSKNNPHFLGSRPSIRPEPGPRFWTLKTQKYPHMLFAKWFCKFQVPSYSLRKVTKILVFCGKWDSLASTEYQKVSNIFHQDGLVELE